MGEAIGRFTSNMVVKLWNDRQSECRINKTHQSS